MNKSFCALATAFVIAGGAAMPAPASAQVSRGAAVMAQAPGDAVQTVQWRRHHHYHRHRHRGWGPALGGLAAGAIIGGAIAAQQAEAARQQEWLAYCSAKYRSFDPATGTYVTRSGQVRPCR